MLYSFTGVARRCPEAGVITDSTGNLYGTTSGGGNSGCYAGFGCGVVFKLGPDGTETVLYSFTGGSDGANPLAVLIRDKAGDLYGTTFYGGNKGCGCGVDSR